MAELRIQEQTLHYTRSGTGDPTLVFVHGMCGGGWVWDDQVERLVDRFACVSYDRRGHSKSPTTSPDQSIATLANDLAALIEGLDLDRPVVVGSSSGAVVTVELLHRYPQLVRGAVLSEPPLFGIDPAAGAELSGTLSGPVGEAAEAGGDEAALEAFFGVVCPTMWEASEESRRAQYRANAGLLFATLEAPGETVTLADVAAIRVPTCVVSGAQSLAPFRTISRLLARALGDSRYIEIEGAGHGTYVDRPEEFANTVAVFANEVSGAGAAR